MQRINMQEPTKDLINDRRAADLNGDDLFIRVMTDNRLPEIIRAEEGEVIIQEGDATNQAYIILYGEVEVRRSGNNGIPKHITTLGENQVFGELAMIDGFRRSASCIARSTVILAEITYSQYVKMCKDKPEIILPLLRVLSDRMRKTLEFIDKVV